MKSESGFSLAIASQPFKRFHMEKNWAQKYICGEKMTNIRSALLMQYLHTTWAILGHCLGTTWAISGNYFTNTLAILRDKSYLCAIFSQLRFRAFHFFVIHDICTFLKFIKIQNVKTGKKGNNCNHSLYLMWEDLLWEEADF